MSIFGWGKRGGGGDEDKGREEGEREVKVLGSGCARCIEQERNVRAALGELGVDTQVEHVTDPTRIAAYGVMSTPALVSTSSADCSNSGRAPSRITSPPVIATAIA